MRLDEILSKIGSTKLIAVSKNVTENEVLELYSQGQIDFGENRVQELKRKKEILKDLNLNWHFIGRLQANKINHLLALHPNLWQSCESFSMAEAVDKRLDYILPTLLQINSAHEESKQGVDPNAACEEFLRIKQSCKNLNLIGVMSIGAHSDDIKEIQKSFESTYKIYENLQEHGAKICSMGMSSDYELAIKCGSNMIRLGTILYK
ncbi:YggS family pyridoxal phosphate-dependent enzyme [Campylobacter fetus]|uniref:YggS family pyridoxal phosphate-dependent enzyme n=1 Tax=Campylobacter fetus TaxID=196 RepID=UPI000FCBC7AF|nr:YggS family pyridoxal phosphate-dependent enzyme [Campylobacter fetus]QQF51664.1 YggS family pyridoxal phosphate-dependent enzyme [Campylobacter fetus subsp. venerealis]RUT51235.1 YggS family pyridoxal phosphate enzyme [Campylobacter fetus]RUT51962.1 YggS family pyridoxal phosphate enzyme [Campylobacter fetus]